MTTSKNFTAQKMKMIESTVRGTVNGLKFTFDFFFAISVLRMPSGFIEPILYRPEQGAVDDDIPMPKRSARVVLCTSQKKLSLWKNVLLPTGERLGEHNISRHKQTLSELSGERFVIFINPNMYLLLIKSVIFG